MITIKQIMDISKWKGLLPKKMLFTFLFFSTVFLQIGFGQNVAMHFDGVDDFLYSQPGGFIRGYDFTIEGWFNSESRSTNPLCTGREGEVLWTVGHDASNYLMLGECNGYLFIANEGGIGFVHLPSVPGAAQIRGGWHHISVVVEDNRRTGGNMDVRVYLDCMQVISGAIGKWDLDGFYLGINKPLTLNTYHGFMDDIKVYDKPLKAKVLCDNKRCIVDDPSAAGLLAYYRFDEGNPNNDNRTIRTVNDYSSNGFDLTPERFQFNGSNSNYVTSKSPVFPRTDLICPVVTSIPFSKDTLDQICSGDPIKLCLLDTAGMQLPRAPAYYEEMNWFYSNDGTTWNLVDPALQNIVCGVVPNDAIVLDCSANALGYEDWQFRGEMKFKHGVDSCYHYTKAIPLRLCCSLDDIIVEGSNSDPLDLLCDMDTTDFSINLSPSYPFITAPSPDISITWKYNGTPLPQFDDLASFNYNNIIIDVAAGACFEATIISKVCNKSTIIDLCFPIDPRPICGTIDTLMMPTVLTQLSSNPKVYEICPGDDAALKIDDPFFNCIPHWQYSFDGIVWQVMGSSNSRQNTNIIPTSAWPGTNIFYRIECRPLSDPSGCEPCYSDTLEIRLAKPLSPGTITGADMFCLGSATTLTHQGHNPSLRNQWYCNGIPVGTGGPTLSATSGGCYWVESTDGCSTISSARFCTMACEVVATISCPDVCPKPGVPITMSACASFDTCNKSLSYQWAVSGSTSPTINGCNITHIPDPGGTTYSVTVTNSIGCAATASVTIVPCQ